MALGRSDILEAIASGTLTIEPFRKHQHLQTAGIQLSLGRKLSKLRPGQTIDLASGKSPEYDEFDIPQEGYSLPPGGFVLGHTFEKVCLPNDLLGMVDGRSTFGRIGGTPHQAAMAIWPGHGNGEGGPRHITLEIKNQTSDCVIVLTERLFIANMTFHRVETAADVAYDRAPSSRYGKDYGKMMPRFKQETLELEE